MEEGEGGGGGRREDGGWRGESTSLGAGEEGARGR